MKERIDIRDMPSNSLDTLNTAIKLDSACRAVVILLSCKSAANLSHFCALPLANVEGSRISKACPISTPTCKSHFNSQERGQDLYFYAKITVDSAFVPEINRLGSRMYLLHPRFLDDTMPFVRSKRFFCKRRTFSKKKVRSIGVLFRKRCCFEINNKEKVIVLHNINPA